MRALEELINTTDPAWKVIQEWIGCAKNTVDVLPVDRAQADESLFHTQVTTRSTMGAVIYETGGLLVDNGWIRILGSGCDRMKRSLPEWNKGKTFQEYGEVAPYLLVADDAIGGFYAINGGFFGNDVGNIYYFAPDMLRWVSLEMKYTDFLQFCFHQDMDEFYDSFRWEGWKDDLLSLKPDYAYSFYPFLWTKEARSSSIGDLSRKAMNVEEVYSLNMDMQATLDQKE